MSAASNWRKANPHKKAPEKKKDNKINAAPAPAEQKTEQKEKTAASDFPGNDKDKKILAIIKENPEGITMPEVAYVMGVAFVSISRNVRKLLIDGRIIKKDNKYYRE